MSAVFHGIVGSAIGFPLVWESTVRFGYLTAPVAASALAALAGLALFVGWHRRLRGALWVVSLATVATALPLAVSTRALVPFGWVLLGLGLGALWIGYTRPWRGPGWFCAVVADLYMVLVAALFLGAGPGRVAEFLTAGPAAGLLIAHALTYFGSIAWWTVWRRRPIAVAGVLQGAASVLVGIGGAAGISRVSALPATSAAIPALVLAAAGYGAAFAFIDRAEGDRRTFQFFATLGLALVVGGTSTLLGGGAVVFALLVAAAITLALGTRRGRTTLTLHSALYVAAAATISGLLRGAGSAFLPGSGAALSWLTSSSLSTVAVAAAGCAVAPAAAGREPPLSQRVARLVPLVVAAVGVGGLAVGLLARLLPVDAAVGGPAPAALAAVRTGVLAAMVVGLAWLAGVRRWADGALLVYPLLALGGIKLLAEDVPAGRPLPLVASLFLYGAALMLASRRVRGLRARGP